jgi:hypothetical protein
MWERLWKMLDVLGRFRFAWGPAKVAVQVGRFGSSDARGGADWERYRTAEALYRVWGPIPGSRWEPYHCVPLFAALDVLRQGEAWPTESREAEDLEARGHLAGAAAGEPLGGNWAADGVWLILDLPGVEAVTLGTRFIMGGYQPVCTFDHWPHWVGMLKPERILAQMLRLAPVVAEARERLRVESPPLWICDRERLGTRRGGPHEFDNRYYLDDSLLPGAATLREAGIRHIVCVVPEATDGPVEDLAAYLAALRKDGFGDIHGVALSDPELRPFSFSPGSGSARFKRSGYQRSAAGGFGRLIPEESSSGG